MTAPATTAAFTRLSAEETALALPRTGTLQLPEVGSGLRARQVLEKIVTDALAAPPCHILFSGGRDSSALLALAVHVARRDGLPEPVPVTVRHPDAPDSHETQWQERVLEHLGIRDHLVLEFRGEQRLLGEVATTAIQRHGVVWPEAIQLHGAVYRHLDPGTIISGEGGDMVLTGHRMAALRAATTRPRRAHLRMALTAARPNVLTRREAVRSSQGAVPPWLRGPAAARYVERLVVLSTHPLRWDTATRTIIRSRTLTVLFTNFVAAVAEYGSRSVNPLADLSFVDALAREAGPLGWGDRTAIFRRLFHDVLPDDVLARRSKAAFNSTRWGPAEREFARSWDGTGIDPEWIDPEALRATWLVEDPHPAADFLLHVAWAHAQGIATPQLENS